MSKTKKGLAADVVNGLSKIIRPEFKSLSKAVDDWENIGGGKLADSLLVDAARRFKASCDLLAAARRVYASFPIKDDEEDHTALKCVGLDYVRT